VTALASPAVPPSSAPNQHPLNDQRNHQPNVYQQAIDRASGAFRLSQSAQSQDDWQLVADRWQQAIDLMARVPTDNPQYAQARQKVSEYRNNLAYAQIQSNRPTTEPNANGTVVIRPPTGDRTVDRTVDRASVPPGVPAYPAPSVASTARSSTAAATAPTAYSNTSFHAPIIRREGNTPVIRVTFNGNQTFDMIVDTGASGTLITQQQAQTLGVIPVAAALVDTASQRGVTVPLGYVNSIEVGGAVATNVLVAIAGPQLGTGLLGHDFFGHYDVTIRANEVEFRERG
jgi:predicted aspartyl protease